jgi:diguanylate cyclase (GGDEF)-like protein
MPPNATTTKNSRIMNMVIILVWLVVFMIIVLGIVFPLVFLTSLKDLYLRNQAETVEMASHYVTEYFENRKTLISVSARMDFVKAAARSKKADVAYRGLPEAEEPIVRSYLQNILEQEESFRFFALMTPGKAYPIMLHPFSFQMGLTEEQYNRGYAFREWVQGTIGAYNRWGKKGDLRPYVSDAFLSNPGIVPAVSISIAVLDDKKDMMGILYVNMILDTLCDYVKDLSFGKTGKVFLVDTTGHLIAHPDILPEVETVSPDGTKSLALRDFSANPMVAKAFKGLIEPGVYALPEEHKTVLATYKKIEPLGWILVLEQDTDEAFGIIRAYAYAIIFLVIFSVIVSFVAFWYISRETAETTRQHNALLLISETDPLTGLLNRRSMMSRMGQLVSDYELRNQGFIIGMFDIDDFKKINDTYGHVFGDVVLREIAIRTVSILRAEDYLFRWGGEEFLVVLRNCDLVRGRGVAEKIRRIIADPPMHDGSTSVGVTITVGLSEYSGGSIESMIVRADEALYLGKRSGKNRVVVIDV